MNESAELRAGAEAQIVARSGATRPMLTLLRRELWEHAALWRAPLAVAAALLLGVIVGRANMPSGIFPVPHDGGAPTPGTIQGFVTTLVVATFGISQYFVMSVVLWFYSTTCLYTERRDRSILFWKSMPVSDAKSVLSKALIVLAAVPLYTYVVTLLTTLLAYGIWSIRGFAASGPPVFWDGSAWLRAEAMAFVWLVLSVLWYAPLTAYLLLISAWARRSVQQWALLPPFIAIIVERIGFGTHYLSTWLLYRLGPGWQSQWEQWFERLFSGPFYYTSGGSGLSSAEAFGGMDPLRGFANIDLWLGLAVAVVLFFAAVRVRRYRDDT